VTLRPRWRRGSADDVAAHDRAVRDLWANGERDRKAGIRDETPEYHRLNARVNELRGPLSPFQRTAAATQHRLDLRDRRRGGPRVQRPLGVRLSDARFRATRPLRAVTGSVRNWRNRRFVQTGKGFVLERATRPLRSSLPVYRDRINPATGRPRRDDAEIYRRRDAAFVRLRERGLAGSRPVRAQDYAPRNRWERGPDAYRSVPARGRTR
jgi:hypothetical protein